MKTTTPELLDEQFNLFVRNVKPKLVMTELQTLAAFVAFQKSGDTNSIPGVDEKNLRVQHIGHECSCGSTLGSSIGDDGLMRCRNCGMH